MFLHCRLLLSSSTLSTSSTEEVRGEENKCIIEDPSPHCVARGEEGGGPNKALPARSLPPPSYTFHSFVSEASLCCGKTSDLPFLFNYGLGASERRGGVFLGVLVEGGGRGDGIRIIRQQLFPFSSLLAFFFQYEISSSVTARVHSVL